MWDPGEPQIVDRLAALCALRDFLAHRLQNCGNRDIAPMTAQLVEVLAQIDGLRPVEREDTALDELAARRAERGAKAPVRARTARG